MHNIKTIIRLVGKRNIYAIYPSFHCPMTPISHHNVPNRFCLSIRDGNTKTSHESKLIAPNMTLKQPTVNSMFECTSVSSFGSGRVPLHPLPEKGLRRGFIFRYVKSSHKLVSQKENTCYSRIKDIWLDIHNIISKYIQDLQLLRCILQMEKG